MGDAMKVRATVGEGRPVVLVHAALQDGSEWDDVMRRAPAGVRAIAIDLPDFGYDAPGTTIASLEQEFRSWLASLGEAVTLVGHSFGGWLVARALHEPVIAVRRAVILGGCPHLTQEMGAGYVQGAEALASGALPRDAFASSVIDAAFGGDGTDALRAQVAECPARYPDDRLVRAMRLVATLAEPAQDVAPYDVPTQLIHSEGDRSVPLALGRELAARGARAELEVWPGESHMLPLTAPDRIAEVAFG